MKNRELNPALVVPFVIVILLIFGYFFFLKPKMEADNAVANFNTPEAQAKRDPEKRTHDATTQAKIDELRAKEQHSGGVSKRHSRD